VKEDKENEERKNKRRWNRKTREEEYRRISEKKELE
jgi:hypothetical protein